MHEKGQGGQEGQEILDLKFWILNLVHFETWSSAGRKARYQRILDFRFWIQSKIQNPKSKIDSLLLKLWLSK